tara:strand:+ start:850 stop:1251 length:402 start_codon:yes stop_codon:yes gene_type:complete
MRIYTVHERPYWLISEADTVDHPVTLVREGFSWFALGLPLIWALWHRLWLVALAMAIVVVAFNAVVVLFELGAPCVSIVGGGLLLWIGFEANDLRRWLLRRNGWYDSGVVSGRDRDEAEWRYHDARRSVPNAV